MDSLEDLEEEEREGVVIKRVRRKREERSKMEHSHRRTPRIHRKL